MLGRKGKTAAGPMQCQQLSNYAVMSMEGDMDTSTAVIMGLALAAGGLVKGATGMGLPLIALPVLTAVLGLQHAVGLMTVPMILTNAWQVQRFRVSAREPLLAFLPLFILAGAVGIGVGTWALTTLPERLLILALGILLLGYVALRLLRPHWSLTAAQVKRWGPFAGLGAGVLQGATGISSPIGVTFIHSMGLARDAHVYAVSAMFLLFSLVQVPALLVAGVMRADWLLQGGLALVPILVFMPLGQWLGGKLSRQGFDRMILMFLGLIGLKMLLGL